MTRCPTVFISYSHKDEDWKDRLQRYLEVLEKNGLLEIWEDRRIKPGDEWSEEIEYGIQKAEIAILLITTEFLRSDFIAEQEVPALLERKKVGNFIIIPLILEPCPWQLTPWLSPLQGAFHDNKPLSELDDQEQERILNEVVVNIGLRIQSSSDASDPVEIMGVKAEFKDDENHEAGPASEKRTPESDKKTLEANAEKSVIKIEYTEEKAFQQTLRESLARSILNADLSDYTITLARHLNLKADNSAPDKLALLIASELLKQGFYKVVKGSLYKLCQFFLSSDDEDLSEQRHPALLPPERKRFIRATNEVIGLLALCELDENIFHDENRLQKLDNSYFLVQGKLTSLGVELLLRRIDNSVSVVPDIQAGKKGEVTLKGRAIIQKRSKNKWVRKSNIDHALIDIWNAVMDHEDPTERLPRRSKNEKLKWGDSVEEDDNEVELLNAKLEWHREHDIAPRCFFIAENLNSSKEKQELCMKLSQLLPALTAFSFQSEHGTLVLLHSERKIRAAIESIYKTFRFFETVKGNSQDV